MILLFVGGNIDMGCHISKIMLLKLAQKLMRYGKLSNGKMSNVYHG